MQQSLVLGVWGHLEQTTDHDKSLSMLPQISVQFHLQTDKTTNMTTMNTQYISIIYNMVLL